MQPDRTIEKFAFISKFVYHGPKGFLAFAPKMQQPEFKAAFTAAEGWGSYHRQPSTGGSEQHMLALGYGRLRLSQLRLASVMKSPIREVTVTHNGSVVNAQTTAEGNDLLVTFEPELLLKELDTLTVKGS